MSRHPELYHWNDHLATVFPGLSPAYLMGLALWTLGMVLARRCGLDSVALALRPFVGQGFDTVRQRLREFYQEADAKAGPKRRDFAVTDCFAPLLAWVLSFWSAKRLALALDVTNLGDRLHVLCVSVLYGGIGIPVAWKILPGNAKGAWNPHWRDLLGRLRGAVGDGWTVAVLSDRGLESAELFGAIVALGWHPLMRAKKGGTFRPAGWTRWYPLGSFVPRVGSRAAFAGRAYKTAPLACTLLGLWDEGYTEAWLILTDLPCGAARPCWYAWRAWIEQGFKVIKGAGLQWQHTRMSDPARLERHWLAIAVTVVWLVAVGAEVERTAAIETLGELPDGGAAEAARRHRLYQVGLAAVLGALVRGAPLPRGRLPEQTWREPGHEMPTLTEQEFVSGKTYS